MQYRALTIVFLFATVTLVTIATHCPTVLLALAASLAFYGRAKADYEHLNAA